MAAAATEKKQESYFADEDEVIRYTLPDKQSFIEYILLDEGLYQEYQDITSKIRLDREGETEVDMALGKQRRFLLERLVTNWNLTDKANQPIKFTHTKLFKLRPNIINDLLQDIYKNNKILSGDAEDSEEGKS